MKTGTKWSEAQIAVLLHIFNFEIVNHIKKKKTMKPKKKENYIYEYSRTFIYKICYVCFDFILIFVCIF